MSSLHLGVIGIGHIGLATALTLAQHGHKVYGLDYDKEKVRKLRDAIPNYYEPGLSAALKRSLIEGSLFLTDQYSERFLNLDALFIAIDTPSLSSGQADLSLIEKSLNSLKLLYLNQPDKPKPLIIIKSTIPPGTTENLSKKFTEFHFAFSPEFLREGSALQDSLYPQRIVIGYKNKTDLQLLEKIYAGYSKEIPVLKMSLNSAELSKYAANTFLATKISLINEISLLCDQFKASIEDIAEVVGLDTRIGPEFLKSGIGYGGHCFPKDLKALSFLNQQLNSEQSIVLASLKINQMLPAYFVNKVIQKLGSIHGRKLTIWGTAFKAHTSDVRSSQALPVLELLLKLGAHLNIHDPQALEETKDYFSQSEFNSSVSYFTDKEDSILSSDALLILTDWPEYINFNWLSSSVYQKKTPIFDGRLCLPTDIRSQLSYQAIGWCL